MKRALLFVAGAILILMLFAMTQTIRADNETCQTGAVGTQFSFSYSGFSPNKYVNAYLVEPDGAAVTYGSFKTDKDGAVTITVDSFLDKSTRGVGTWKIVVEEYASGQTLVKRFTNCFTIVGRAEGVSGASLISEYKEIYKSAKGMLSYKPNGKDTVNYWGSTSTKITGSGFLPGEIVSIWLESPNGECSSLSIHETVRFNSDYSLSPDNYNIPYLKGVGAFGIADAKADKDGIISGNVYFYISDCQGVWRIVARGNTSKRGAETQVTLLSSYFKTDALLAASSESVDPMKGYISFSGSDFDPNEHITCWVTSPQGQVVGYPDNSFDTLPKPPPTPPPYSATGTGDSRIPESFLSENRFFADADGNFVINFVTGSFYRESSGTSSWEPLASQGALGAWAMSCRGDTSGKVGIARFCLGGCPPPPQGKESSGAIPAGSSGGGAPLPTSIPEPTEAPTTFPFAPAYVPSP